MNTLKSIFISLYITLLFAGSARPLMMLSDDSSWYWVLLALAPGLLFFVWLFLFNVARTGQASFLMWASPILAISAQVLFSRVPSLEQWAWMLAAFSGGVLYEFWYSQYSHRDSKQLQLGATLPDIILETPDGKPFSTNDISGPLLLMFYRGNWCPLCMAQIKEISQKYQELASLGVHLLMISPQPHKQTQGLAKRMNVPMHFLVDKDLKAARQLGIEAVSGLPVGLEALGYDRDTVMPTVIITDHKRKILFADQTDDYRKRPEPDTFLKILSAAGV